MPELPEVETTVRGIAPYLKGRIISAVKVSNSRLRWPVPTDLRARVVGQVVRSVRRRAKYILIELNDGHILIHLGMSGSLRMTPVTGHSRLHDHVEFEIDGAHLLRLHDPRRFGCVLWIGPKPETCQLLAHLGVEPLADEFDGHHLYRAAQGRKVAVKNLIMNNRIVVGVGNIYASEALFRACIHPHRPAGRISLKRYSRLAQMIQATLDEAIRAGGTTLRDFVDGAGNPGYFVQNLQVYGRAGQPCVTCATMIKRKVIGQRSSFYCSHCQK